MERPKKEDYDFNDYLEGVRFAINMTKYVDYLEAKQLPIRVVSQRSELLLFDEYIYSNEEQCDRDRGGVVDRYLAKK